jgi:mannose-6-phosphate isomerase
LIEQYGTKDIGIVFIFFFNIFNLQKDQAVVITPNVPHAYISGELVECMINSDNVVRGGLTPKMKDTDTLYNMLPYDMTERSPINGKKLIDTDKSQVVEYKTGFEEFRVFKIEITGQGESVELKFNTFSMVVVLSGKGEVEVEEFGKFKIDTYC